MFRTRLTCVAVIFAPGGAVFAETFEVQMLNKGAEGNMVFEPGFLRVAPGDTVKFIAARKGHNAESFKK